MPRVVIIGAGCIGQWIGGHLASAGVEVVLAGRSVLQRTLKAGKLQLTDVERDAEGFDLKLNLPGTVGLKAVLDLEEALRPNNFDAAFVCLKVHDNSAAAPLAALKSDTVIVSLQNGVENQRILSSLLPKHTVVPGMVPYGVVEVSPGHFRRGTYGALAFSDSLPGFLTAALRKSGLAVELHCTEDMIAVQWLKLVINLNNALNAVVGQPLATCMEQRNYRLLMSATWEEGLAVMDAKGIRLKGDINGQPLQTAAKLLRLPDLVLKVAQRIKGVKALDPSYHSSMFYDLDQNRMTEITELNGRVVDMASEMQMQAPVNVLLTRLVQEAQKTRNGSPRVPIKELLLLAERAAPDAFASGMNLGSWFMAAFVALIVAWASSASFRARL